MIAALKPAPGSRSIRPRRAREADNIVSDARLARPGASPRALLACAAPPAAPAPLPTRLVYATGEIVPIPASVPHEEGDMVDRRIVPDLRWIAARFPIYVTDGYSGPLPNGEHVGCNSCHVKRLRPLQRPRRRRRAAERRAADATAAGPAITRLAHWAEPRPEPPRPPFRWVGYDGDAGHGCGNHLHLSWEHAPAPMFQLAEWVEVFPVGSEEGAGASRSRPPARERGPPAASRRSLRRRLHRRLTPAAGIAARSAADLAARLHRMRPMRRSHRARRRSPGSPSLARRLRRARATRRRSPASTGPAPTCAPRRCTASR